MARKAGPPAQMPFQHYRPFTPIPLPDRTWPSKVITRAKEVSCSIVAVTWGIEPRVTPAFSMCSRIFFSAWVSACPAS